MEPSFTLSLTLEESDVEQVDPVTFWKEVIYECPRFEKKTANSHIQFSVDEALIDHWVKTSKLMLENGVEHPVPIGHTKDPEKRRGSVIDWKKAKNPKRDVWSLYEKIKFNDLEAAKLARSTNVSIMVDPEMIDGRGNKYKLPLVHTALTDYPVIPGLESFQAIALSFGASPAMTLQELATKVGVNPQLPPDQLIAAIAAAWDAMKLKAAPPAPPVPGAPPRPPGLSQDDDEEVEKDEEDDEEEEVDEPKVSMALVELSRDNRVMKLEKLLKARKITPAVHKNLVKRFTTDATLKLSLSDKDDGFNVVLETLEANEPVFKTGGKTGVQSAVELSQGDAPMKLSDSPMVKNAIKRAEAAKK